MGSIVGAGLACGWSDDELDRRILKECFRQARKIQTRLKLDYQVQ